MQTVAMGVLIMDMFPEKYGVSLRNTKAWIPIPGGAPANVAVAWAKLDAESTFLGEVGKDEFGEELVECLRNHNVNTSLIGMSVQLRTTLNFHAKPLPDFTEYMFYRHPGADTAYVLNEKARDVISSSKVLHMDTMSFTDSPMKDSALEAIKIAKANHVWVSLDFNYRQPIWKSAVEAVTLVKNLLPYVDVFKANEEEAKLLYPTLRIDEISKKLLECGPSIVIITLGHEGSIISQGTITIQTPTLQVTSIDSIGCGDAFAAGFLLRALENDVQLDQCDEAKLREAAMFATVVAGLTATKKGALAALPSRKEVEYFLCKAR